MATKVPKDKAADKGASAVMLDVEAASRLKDPYEQHYMGVLRSNDAVLLEKGAGNYDLYRNLKLDGKVFDGLQKRTLALVGYEWAVEQVVGDTQGNAVAHVTQALKRINFDQACKDLLEALLVGMAVCEIVWTQRDGWIVPERLIKRKPSRFVFVQTDERQTPELRLLTTNNMLTGEPLPDRKFIVHRVNAEDDNPYGNGLGAQSYWPVFFKRRGIVAWNKLIDRFGAPTSVGKHPAGATQREKSTLLAAMVALAQDGAVTIPEGMSIDLLESKLTGSINTHAELLNYMDDWLDAVWMGKDASSKNGGAMAAAAKERSDIRMALTKGDADLLSGTLNETLIKWMCEINGWAPCQVYRQIKEETDLKVESETDANVAAMGFVLSEEGVRAKYGEYWIRSVPAVGQGIMDAGGGRGVGKVPAPQNETPADDERNAASFAEGANQRDAIDALVDNELAAWQPLLEPMAEPIRKMLEEAAQQGLTAAQVLDRLPQCLQQMDSDPLATSLTSAAFAARLAGAGGATLD